MIAMVVLSIVVFGVMSAIVLTRDLLASKEREDATLLCSRFFEACEAISLKELTASSADVPPGVEVPAGFSVSKTVSNVSADTSIATVSLTVSWNSAGRRNGSMKMSREVSFCGWQNVGEFPTP